MAVTVVELNDSEIRVARGTDIVLRTPGYAVVHNGKIELGDAAVNLARLNPRAVYNRYWSKLNEDALQHPCDHARHHADLAYAHLLAIHEQAGKPDELLFAVPSNFTNQQLALLLGLVDASPVKKTVGLVDIAVAAAAQTPGSGEHVYIDIYLHHVIVTQITMSDFVSKGSVQVVDGAGLAAIYDASAALIADLFINQTRFDPQHHAETEQALYNQIPSSLASLRTLSEVSLEFQYRGTQYQTKLASEVLIEALQPIYQKILNAIPAAASCVLGDRLCKLPGFVDLLPGARLLEPTAIAHSCQQHLLQIHSAGPTLEFITRLPAAPLPAASEAPTEKPPAPETIEKPRVTHILNNYRAYPLRGGPLYLSATDGTSNSDAGNSSCSVAVDGQQVVVQPQAENSVVLNGQRLSGPAQVQAGDMLSFADSKTEYRFISEVD